MRRSFPLLAVCLSCACIGTACAIPAAKTGGIPTPQSAQGSQAKETSRLRASLLICKNHNGRIETSFYSAADLLSGRPIRVDGYVTGVILLADDGTEAFIDGRPLDTAPKRGDGSYDFSYFYRSEGNDIESSLRKYIRTGGAQTQACLISYDTIPGNCLRNQKEFIITVKSGPNTFEQVIQQSCCHNLFDLAAAGPGYDDLKCFYFGSSPSQFRERAAEFQERLASIASGIRAVEADLGQKFVRRINLIDLAGQYNALTKCGADDIWMYVATFWSEPVVELRRMAEHETLHIVTDRYRLTRNTGIRSLFAELRGFEPHSAERSALVTKGCLPADAARYQKRAVSGANHFFAFINEKNFITGAKGGHSSDNLDEFCASFLHTLMYFDQLDSKLAAPIISASGLPISPRPADRTALSEDYQRCLAAFSRAADDNPGGPDLSSFIARLTNPAEAVARRDQRQ